ncbi:unnamed protein product, partial [Meganyctiphanes norvegica]
MAPLKCLWWPLVTCLLVTTSWYGVCALADYREDPSLYNIGVGIYDATGPVAGVNMMGYANPAQINSGLHIRLYSRAFIIDDSQSRLVFVSVDCGMMAQLIKLEVVKQLEEVYGSLYTTENVMLSGTHTHSGPAGFFQYLLFDITSQGFIQETFDTMVTGIVQSIKMAHDSMTPGYIYVTSGELLDASINRSPTSYLANPEEEKAKYEYDTDKTMTLLKFTDVDGNGLGMLNWFAVHPTSMNNTNLLVSGDNKGYAEQLFEEQMNPGSLPGQGKFVAAFAQSNCGDVSPNIQGPLCQDSGLPCDMYASTCNGNVHWCWASGPGKDMQDSTRIIGERQYNKAWELYNSDTFEPLSGPVQFAQQYINMDNYTVQLQDGTTGSTCRPALGYSFAAGTTDGPGAFDFTQGMTEGNAFWNMVAGLLGEPSQEQIDCQAPKPILLDTGDYNYPYPWHPHILDTQLGRVGQLAILAVPGEFTTMSGRRIRDHLSDTLTAAGVSGPIPVIAGLSNVYTHYVATWEEYQMQRYEAASTIYGPHTLEAYMQQFAYLATNMVQEQAIPPGPSPPFMIDDQITLLPGVMYDAAGIGYSFGEVIAQPYPMVYAGETILAKFVTGHPRNDPMLGRSFLLIEHMVDQDTWETVATDASWSTRFVWERISSLLGTSSATVYWDVPEETPEGIYRIVHTGHYKTLFRGIDEYSGTSNTFKVKTSLSKAPSICKVSKRGANKEFWSR